MKRLKLILFGFVVTAITISFAVLTGIYASSLYADWQFKEERQKLTDIVLAEMGTISNGDTLRSYPLLEVNEGSKVFLQSLNKDGLLVFFVQSSCGACEQQLAILKSGAVSAVNMKRIILVLNGSIEEVTNYQKRHNTSCSVLSDIDMQYQLNYRIYDSPFALVLDGSMCIRNAFVGTISGNEINELFNDLDS